jgi:hypothetical protein
MVKPIFENKSSTPQSSSVKDVDKKITFDRPPINTATTVPTSTVGSKINFGTAPIVEPKPVVEQRKIKEIQFSSAPIITKSVATAIPVTSLIKPSCENVHVAWNQLKSDAPQIYGTDGSESLTVLERLFPLKLTVLLEWGTKELERSSATQKKATQLISTITDMKVNEYITDLQGKLKPSSNKFFNKIKTSVVSVIPIKSTLTVYSQQMIASIPQCDQFNVDVQNNFNELAVRFYCLQSVSKTIGVISDNTLDTTMSNRLRLLQQAMLQTQLTIQQLSDLKNHMCSMTNIIDTFINVTIPAFEAL